MDAKIVLPMYLAIALGYVFLPILLLALFDTRKPRRVTCPGDGEEALVQLDAGRMARNLLVGGRPLVWNCSRWPKAGCERACEAALTGQA